MNSALSHRLIGGLLSVVVAASIGCGGSATALVSGSVTHGGKPVTGGTLTFSTTTTDPSAGAASYLEINPDGTFSGSVVVGEQRISYQAPSEEPPPGDPNDADAVVNVPTSPYEGLNPNPALATIVAGENKVDITLTK